MLNNVKEKRKRVSIDDDDSFADCLAGSEDENLNSSSIDDAVKAIMSQGGKLDSNGALARPKKKKKVKNTPSVMGSKVPNNSCSNGTENIVKKKKNPNKHIESIEQTDDLNIPNKAEVKKKSSEQMEMEHQEINANEKVPNEEGSISNCMNTTYSCKSFRKSLKKSWKGKEVTGM